MTAGMTFTNSIHGRHWMGLLSSNIHQWVPLAFFLKKKRLFFFFSCFSSSTLLFK